MSPGRLAHTYSIVAVDPAAGEMGAAVQSHWFSVGSVVPWAEAGAGVVVTQSFVNPSYGPRGLDMLREGMTARQVVDALTAGDEGRDLRQVAVLDLSGAVVARTGSGCIPEAGDLQGKGVSVQANMMLRPTVPAAMLRAFEAAEGPLAERLVAALVAAEEEGGDIRGRQSAALLVVRTVPSGRPWQDRLVDLRVEDSSDPVGELSRLLRVHRAYEHMDRGDVAMERGDHQTALEAYSAAERLYPENEEMVFWTAVSLANQGRLEDALPRFSRTFQRNDQWRTMTARLADKGQLRLDDRALQRVLSLGRPPAP